MERVYRPIIRRPKLILIVIVLLTGFFAHHARHIRTDSSAESILPQRDPEKDYYDEVRRLFGSDDVAVIGLFTPTTSTPPGLPKGKNPSPASRKKTQRRRG